jgi:hypothetical protein
MQHDDPEARERGETPEERPAQADWPQHDLTDDAGAARAPEAAAAPPGEAPPGEAEAYDRPPSPRRERQAAQVVPATGPSEATRCPRCGTENRPGLAFCSNCGQRLVAAGAAQTVPRPGTPEGTAACPRCGTHNRAGVAFCQNCGASMRPAEAAAFAPPRVQPGAPAAEPATTARRAVLGPVVLLIGAAGMLVGWLLPFRYGPENSLFERGFGADGYGVLFWSGYPDVSGTLADQAYFGFAAPSLILVALLGVLAVAGLFRARPGALQLIGLLIALLWAAGLVGLFVVAEVLATSTGDLVAVLRDLTPAGIIFFLAGLIVIIGTLTRLARS